MCLRQITQIKSARHPYCLSIKMMTIKKPILLHQGNEYYSEFFPISFVRLKYVLNIIFLTIFFMRNVNISKIKANQQLTCHYKILMQKPTVRISRTCLPDCCRIPVMTSAHQRKAGSESYRLSYNDRCYVRTSFTGSDGVHC